MKRAVLVFPFVSVLGLVVYVGWPFDGFTLWNCLPVLLGFFVLIAGLRSRHALFFASVIFAVIATLLTALFHLAWLFDWGGTATSSSTSSLAFIFVPVWSLGLAFVAAAITWAIFNFVRRNSSHVA